MPAYASFVQNGAVQVYKFEPSITRTASGGLPRPASVQRALSILAMEVEQIKKGNYNHYMQVRESAVASGLTA